MKKILATIVLILPCVVFALGNTPQAMAATTVDFNNLIDDQVFDSPSMTAAQIDSFLNGFSGSCISSNNGFRAPDPTGYSPSKGFTYGSNVTAGKVIFDAASAYGLNPQVLLATLQKEQSLVSGGGGCSALAYVGALGYGCPDGGTTHNYSGVDLYTLNGREVTSVSGTCVSSSLDVGFSQQIIHATWLFKFDEERSEGKVTWAVIKGNWNNTDDLSTCYSGFMTQGTFQRCPSGSAAFFDGDATIDGTSIHMDDGATAALYDYTPHKSGNSNFVTIFTTWFGGVRGTPFFRIGNTNAVYILGSNNNYYHVPTPSILTAYGYGRAFNTEDIVQSSYISGLTSSGELPIIADFGGSPIYLLDTGGAHHFPSQAILNAFGYTTGQAAQLPSWIYDKLVHPEDMQLVVTQASAPEVYYMQNGKKSHITSPQAFSTLGSPTYASQSSVRLTNAYVASLSTGAPILTAGTLVRASDTGAYGIWDGTLLQALNTTAANDLGIPPGYTASAGILNQLPKNTIAVDKLASDGDGALYILDKNQKLLVTTDQLSNLGLSSSSFAPVASTFLDRLTTVPMQSLIRINNGAAVYLVQAGRLYHIASGNDLAALGHDFSEVANVNTTTSSLFTNSNGAILEQGRLVRVGSTPQVYLIDGTFTKKYIPSSQIFSEFGFRMADVESVSSSDVNTYPTTGNLTQVIKSGAGVFWLVDSGLRHKISTTMLDSSHYSINQATTPTISDQNLANLPTGTDLTNIVQAPGDSKVYEVTGGQKHWFTTRASFDTNGGDWNNIEPLSSTYIASLPTGAPISS